MLKTEYKFGEVNDLTTQIQIDDEKVQSRNIFTNDNGGVTLLALKNGQALTTHTAPAEVMVHVLVGEIEFTMLDKVQSIRSGEFLLMGQDVPHSVVAKADSKVILVKIKP